MELNFSRKRKLCCVLGNEYCSNVELPANALSPAASGTPGCNKFDEATEIGRRRLRSPDLEDVDLRYECFGTAISTSVGDIFSRKATPVIELCGDSKQVMLTDLSSESTKKPISPPPASPVIKLCGDSKQVMLTDSSSESTKKPISPPPASPQRKISASVGKTTSAEELEEFFAEAEEYVQKRFAEKYNYDIVKDAPILEGRYQWVRIHP